MEKGLLKSMGTVLTLFLIVRNCFECISFIIKLNSLKYLPIITGYVGILVCRTELLN